jgi:hypothetical protein
MRCVWLLVRPIPRDMAATPSFLCSEFQTGSRQLRLQTVLMAINGLLSFKSKYLTIEIVAHDRDYLWSFLCVQGE